MTRNRTLARSTKLFSFIALIAFFSAGLASASEKWIHVKVDSSNGDKVSVNLPISLIGAAADMVPDDIQAQFGEETKIAFDELDMSWGELHDFWTQIKDSPDATYVTVESENETVVVKREGDYLLVQSDENGGSDTEIDIRFPMAVIDALLSGPKGQLDFKAALEALADQSHGHIVSVRDGEDTIKVWIDDKNETR